MEFRTIYLNGLDLDNAALLGVAWRQIEKDGARESLFYDGTIKTEREFFAETLRPGTLPFIVLGGAEIAAFCWINGITSRMGRTHFFISRKFRGRKLREPIGRNFFRYILARKDAAGHLFDCLYGITPVSNPLAWRAALACGWERRGEIPNACYIARRGESEAGVITCATREILGIGENGEAGPIWSYTKGS